LTLAALNRWKIKKQRQKENWTAKGDFFWFVLILKEGQRIRTHQALTGRLRRLRKI